MFLLNKMETMDYTISSVDYTCNNRIYTNIEAPHTESCKLTITSLTTMANFVVLDKSDYITINDVKYRIRDDFSDVNTASLVEYLNGIIDADTPTSDLAAYYDSCSRIYFTSKDNIIINDCSYNLRLMMGLVNVPLPFAENTDIDDGKMLTCPDVGLYLSTPVLYLACNLGSNSYKNTTKSQYTSMRILMRLINSFFAKQPINNPNGDYTTIVRCSDLSDIRFTLVDANYHEVKLLSPMYLTVQIEAIPDAEDKKFNAPANIQNELQMTEYAYMRDCTERGREYDIETIGNLIYIDQPNDVTSNEQSDGKNNENNNENEQSQQQ